MDGLTAIKNAWCMMNEHKVKLFLLNCRFIGWAILSVLTFGIGFIWLIPYMKASITIFFFKKER